MAVPRLLPLALVVGLAVVGLVVVAPPPGHAAPIHYMAFGDSITQGTDIDDCPCNCQEACGYPWRLEKRLPFGNVVENQGLGGEKTNQGLDRLATLLPTTQADVLLLMEGTNDISKEISPETTIFDLGEMARMAADYGIETVHATLIPRYPDAKVDADNVLNAAMAQRIRDLAGTHDRRLVDPFEVFVRIPNLFGQYYAVIEGDPVGHPNPDGFQLLAEVFYDALTGIDEVPPVVGFVEPADGAQQVQPWPEIRVRLYDFGAGVDAAATTLSVDGSLVPAAQSGDGAQLDLLYSPAAPLSGEVTVTVATRDLASPPHAWNRPVSTFSVANGGAVELTAAEVAADQDRVEAVRKRLAVATPGSSHPTVTILTPARSGGVQGSTHLTQHDASGAPNVAPETRLVWVALHDGQARRTSFDYAPLGSLVRIDPASDLVAPGDPGEIRLTLASGGPETFSADNRAFSVAGPDSGPTVNLEPALTSDHEELLTARDWLVFDLLHEVLDVELCDNVSGAATHCYSAFVQVNRRPDPNRYQMKIGCLDGGCGDVLLNLSPNYGPGGTLTNANAELLLDDPRNTLTKELVVRFKEPTEPGVLWQHPHGTLAIDNQGTIANSKPSFATLYALAHPSRLDPAADPSR